MCADIDGFSLRHFPLLVKLAPVDDDSPDRLQQRAHEAGLSSDYVALRDEHHRDGRRLLDRLRALRLSVRPGDGCLMSGADDARPVVLLPTEAHGVAVDMVALALFARRDRHKGLCKPQDVLQEMKNTCLAGVRCFGAVHKSFVDARLTCASGSDEPPSLTALLYRVTPEYDRLRSLCGTSTAAAAVLKSLPGLRPWPSNTDIVSFARGDLPHLVAPFSRHVLRALPHVHEESSCFTYDTASVLSDGTTRVEYRCARCAATQAAKQKRDIAGISAESAVAASAGGFTDGSESVVSDSPSEYEQVVDGCDDDDLPDDIEESGSGAGNSSADEHDGGTGSDVATCGIDLQIPPKLRRKRMSRSSFAAAAAKAVPGLRTASAPVTAPPKEPYVQDCNAGLFVYVPPRALPGAAMLIMRRLSPGAAGSIARHSHRLDEHLPIADVLEQRILREMKSTGSFSHSSAEVKDWLGNVLPLIGECDFSCSLQPRERQLSVLQFTTHIALQRRTMLSMLLADFATSRTLC
jgi:hypothetical protein